MKPSSPTMLPFTVLRDKGSFLPACLFKADFVLLRGAEWTDSEKRVLVIHNTGTTSPPKRSTLNQLQTTPS